MTGDRRANSGLSHLLQTRHMGYGGYISETFTNSSQSGGFLFDGEKYE